jgi:hypothetical protein
MANRNELMIANQNAVAMVDGKLETIEEGKTIVRRGDQMYKENPDLFSKAQSSRPDVEEATARPGAQRGKTAAA